MRIASIRVDHGEIVSSRALGHGQPTTNIWRRGKGEEETDSGIFGDFYNTRN